MKYMEVKGGKGMAGGGEGMLGRDKIVYFWKIKPWHHDAGREGEHKMCVGEDKLNRIMVEHETE
jgi:hypothetical protein